MAYVQELGAWEPRWSPAGETPASSIPGAEPYEDFNSGVSWDAVRLELAREQAQATAQGQYMYVSRGTVLGRMRQRKQEAYGAYLSRLQRLDDDLPF